MIKTYIPLLTLVLFIWVSCGYASKGLHKKGMDNLYLNNSLIITKGEVIKSLKRNSESIDDYYVIKYDRSKTYGFYQMLSACDHCRTDRFFYYNKNIYMINDSVLTSETQFIHSFMPYLNDSMYLGNFYHQMMDIRKANDGMNYNF